ncbi:MAG: heavy metal translocating P-type ATPase [Opitutaceae bacterium]
MPATASAKTTECTHCGTPFIAKSDETYCCHGCYYVAQLIDEQDLGRFYELKGKQVVPPVGSKVFHENDTAALVEVIKERETLTDKPVANARLSIEGISCIGCVWLIEAIFKRQTGAANIRIDPRSSAVEISWQSGNFDIHSFAIELQKIGYRLNVYSEDPNTNNQTKQLTHRLGLCGFFLLNTMLFTLPGYLGMKDEFFLAPLFQLLGALFATLSLLVGGGYFISRAWQAARNKVLHIDLPISIGLVAAYLGSLIGWYSGTVELIYFDFVATFVFLMLAGRWLQEYALEKNRSHLQRQQVGPRQVTQVGGANDGQRIAVQSIQNDLEYSIAPGEINPVAADLLETSGTLSLEWINGEAEPVIWKKERITPAGSINVGMQSLRLRARENWDDSLLAKLLERPADPFQETRLQTVLKWYIGTILVIAAVGSSAWLIVTGDILKATQVLISILVVSCPCALGVALPMCDEFATTRLRRAGLFIKSSQIWERIRSVNTVVFDKTGTLTMDIPRLDNPEVIKGLDPLSAKALAQLVDHNLHPIARSLREALLAYHPHLGHDPLASSIVEESIGNGVTWKDTAKNEWSLGKPRWKAAHDDAQLTHSVLRQNGLLVAGFNFSEDVRDDARNAIDTFRSAGLSTTILSGDVSDRVAQIAQQLDLRPEQTRASCTPSDKAEWIDQNAKGTALMIGDGANDSLAFDKAICRGTPVVDRSILQASADFFFFGRSLRCIPELFSTAAMRRQTIRMVFTAAVFYNCAAVALCLMGKMHPLLAAILMPLSSIATLAIAGWGMSRRRSA